MCIAENSHYSRRLGSCLSYHAEKCADPQAGLDHVCQTQGMRAGASSAVPTTHITTPSQPFFPDGSAVNLQSFLTQMVQQFSGCHVRWYLFTDREADDTSHPLKLRSSVMVVVSIKMSYSKKHQEVGLCEVIIHSTNTDSSFSMWRLLCRCTNGKPDIEMYWFNS